MYIYIVIAFFAKLKQVIFYKSEVREVSLLLYSNYYEEGAKAHRKNFQQAITNDLLLLWSQLSLLYY